MQKANRLNLLARCNCYVSRLSTRDQFGLRFGAHAEACPVYAPANDPVNRANDDQVRLTYSERVGA